MKKFVRTAGIVLGILLLILAIGPFLIPIPPLEGTVPAEQLTDPDSKFMEVNGLNIHYKTYGQVVFFFITNTLIAFGMTLMLSDIGWKRFTDWKSRNYKGLL